MARFAVAGLGRIGTVSLWLLHSLGYDAYGISNTLDSVEAARSLGLRAYVGDIVANPRVLEKYGGADVVLLALPGALGYRGLRGLVDAGYNVVDVSFFPEDPGGLEGLARRRGSTVVVDAGVAPGLSNMLVARARRLVEAERALVFVGSVSREPDSLLGIVPAWSIADMLDEYTRPARMIVDGRLVSLDPLGVEPGRIEVPALGELEYAPTDGLRSLLKTLGGEMRELVEYTLRWPGHYRAMRLLRRIGLLSEKPVNADGCPVRPKTCLARLLEANLPRGEDMVVLIVAAEGPAEAVRFQSIVLPRDGVSAVSLSTASFQVGTALMVAEGKLSPGLHYPEEIGLRSDLSRRMIRFLEARGIVVTERFCKRLEECIQPPPPSSGHLLQLASAPEEL